MERLLIDKYGYAPPDRSTRGSAAAAAALALCDLLSPARRLVLRRQAHMRPGPHAGLAALSSALIALATRLRPLIRHYPNLFASPSVGAVASALELFADRMRGEPALFRHTRDRVAPREDTWLPQSWRDARRKATIAYVDECHHDAELEVKEGYTVGAGASGGSSATGGGGSSAAGGGGSSAGGGSGGGGGASGADASVSLVACLSALAVELQALPDGQEDCQENGQENGQAEHVYTGWGTVKGAGRPPPPPGGLLHLLQIGTAARAAGSFLAPEEGEEVGVVGGSSSTAATASAAAASAPAKRRTGKRKRGRGETAQALSSRSRSQVLVS